MDLAYGAGGCRVSSAGVLHLGGALGCELLDLASGIKPSLDLERSMSKESNGLRDMLTSSTDCGLRDLEESGTGRSLPPREGSIRERDLDRGLPSQTEDSDSSTSFHDSSSGLDPLWSDRDLSLDVSCFIRGLFGGCQGGGSNGGIIGAIGKD